MIGDQERQRLATLKAHYDNLEILWEDHQENIYKQIADTDKTISKLEKQLSDIANAARNQK